MSIGFTGCWIMFEVITLHDPENRHLNLDELDRLYYSVGVKNIFIIDGGEFRPLAKRVVKYKKSKLTALTAPAMQRPELTDAEIQSGMDVLKRDLGKFLFHTDYSERLICIELRLHETAMTDEHIIACLDSIIEANKADADKDDRRKCLFYLSRECTNVLSRDRE